MAQVPTVHGYSGNQRALGAKIEQIKAAWPCLKHGVCYIDADSEHHTMNRFRYNSWGTALVRA